MAREYREVRLLSYIKIVGIVFLVVLYWNTVSLKKEVFRQDFNSVSSKIKDLNLTEYDSIFVPPPGYLVWNKNCRMLDVDPFTADALKIFQKKNYTLCSEELPITKLIFDINVRTYSIYIDDDATKKLIGIYDNVSCCYQTILRSGSGQRVDKDYKLEACVPILPGNVIPPGIEGILINCKSLKRNETVQKDGYFLVQDKAEVQKRLESFKNKNTTNKERPISVLMWGIDSMSKFNLRRVMPETTAKLLKNNWFELKGYNKVDDNTFPNFMAFLSGYNLSTVDSKCHPKEPGGLDNCNIIWDLFRDNGYVTSYAEDETWMSTFDFVRKGFKKVPVDYYHRPFMLGIENNLQKQKMWGMSFCLGRRHSAEYIYDFALEFANRFKTEPYFGLFWSNTFTHNSFDVASIMDTRISSYLDQLKKQGILDESIVILFRVAQNSSIGGPDMERFFSSSELVPGTMSAELLSFGCLLFLQCCPNK